MLTIRRLSSGLKNSQIFVRNSQLFKQKYFPYNLFEKYLEEISITYGFEYYTAYFRGQFVSNYPQAWLNFYQQKNYQEVDYPFEILHKTKEIFTWGDLREDSLTPIQKKIFSQAREHSICSGIAMSFKTPCPLEGFTLATSTPERKIINYNNLISKDMIFIQLLFHQVLSSSPRLSFSYLDPFLTHLKENHQTRMKHFAASLSLLESLDFFLKQAILPTKVKCLTQELLETLRSNLIDLLSF